MIFSYKARGKDGEVVEGVLNSFDRFSLASELRGRGLAPLSVKEKKENFFDRISKFENILSKVSVADQIILTKNLSGMLKAGLSLGRALSVLEKQSKNPALNKVLVSLTHDINSGESLSVGLSKFPKIFSKLFVSMTRSGEESGNLSGALLDIGTNLDKMHSLNKKYMGRLFTQG